MLRNLVIWLKIAKPFAIGEYEITFDEYDQFAHATGRPLPSDQAWGRGRRPVINVSWEDAVAYGDWLSRMTGKPYRLPSEAEWDYAARARSETWRFWGDDPNQACRYANVADQSFRQAGYVGDIHDCDDGQPVTVEAGFFEANGFGLYDMLGNVWEWVRDCPASDENTPVDGSAWTEEPGAARVVRGGSWNNEPRRVRAAVRNRNAPHNRNNNLGFRLAIPPTKAQSRYVHGYNGRAVWASMSPFPGLAGTGAPNSIVTGRWGAGPKACRRSCAHFQPAAIVRRQPASRHDGNGASITPGRFANRHGRGMVQYTPRRG